ncbi:MAG: stage II sporulation protein R [Acutalibacteraceae bacterium]|nr:stage II sporulation protein R [Acutalibacteraceae bacterium]
MKKINLAICLGLIFAVVLNFARFDTLCNDLRHNVLRLHIVANSDSSQDQNLKLAVRDAILHAKGEAFGECENLDEAISFASNNAEEFKNIALSVIKENGYDYDVEVFVGDSYFGNREYDDFTLPAGTYESLNIRIGEANGKNWWCVCFPAVCIGAACDLRDGVSNDSAEIAEQSEKLEIKFKTVEIYEEIKKFFLKSEN